MQWRGSTGELSMSPASDASLSTAGRPNRLQQPVGLSAISMLSPATLMDCPQQGHHWQGALPRFCRFLLTSPLCPGLPWQAPVLVAGGLAFHSDHRIWCVFVCRCGSLQPPANTLLPARCPSLGINSSKTRAVQLTCMITRIICCAAHSPHSLCLVSDICGVLCTYLQMAYSGDLQGQVHVCSLWA